MWSARCDPQRAHPNSGAVMPVLPLPCALLHHRAPGIALAGSTGRMHAQRTPGYWGCTKPQRGMRIGTRRNAALQAETLPLQANTILIFRYISGKLEILVSAKF
jgi:hypothetical protein